MLFPFFDEFVRDVIWGEYNQEASYYPIVTVFAKVFPVFHTVGHNSIERRFNNPIGDLTFSIVAGDVPKGFV